MKVATWKYKRYPNGSKKHHCYVCPRCEREVDNKENFCPTCGKCFSKAAYEKYKDEE